MSLFKLDESYNNNEVYLEEGYYDFDEIADWVLENLDESVLLEYKKALKNRRMRDLKNLTLTYTKNPGVDAIRNTEGSFKSYGNNKNMQRTKLRLAKQKSRLLGNKGREYEKNYKISTNNVIAVSDDDDKKEYEKAKKNSVLGQALPFKGHLRDIKIGDDVKKTRIENHEEGHSKQWGDAYLKHGTKGIAKMMEVESKLLASGKNKGFYKKASDEMKKMEPLATNYSKLANEYGVKDDNGKIKKFIGGHKALNRTAALMTKPYSSIQSLQSKDLNSGYGKSSMEKNANDHALEGDSRRVVRDRKNIVNTYMKGVNRARQLNDKNSAEENLNTQARLGTMPRKEFNNNIYAKRGRKR